jgi:hypothetical protein
MMTTATTTWNTIPGFERYEITDFGQVRNSKTGRLMKSSMATGGYPKLNLRAAATGQPKTVYTNVAVLSAFVGNIPDDATILHRDRLRGNCRLPNLGWVTLTECTYVVESGDGYTLLTVPIDLEHGPATGAFCRNGHRLALNRRDDDNTLVWGVGNRVCRICNAPHGLPALDQSYSLHFGVGRPCSGTVRSTNMMEAA